MEGGPSIQQMRGLRQSRGWQQKEWRELGDIMENPNGFKNNNNNKKRGTPSSIFKKPQMASVNTKSPILRNRWSLLHRCIEGCLCEGPIFAEGL
ncbi:Hypothetical protein FKW44_018704 [Caligus rogercresseyi]|uniref:Uncharacterized protein n=1 Tax=Caligus rogercresseyi TaxID=217165 RepID=A0A7T8GVD6_CALRO|nr:Hypothetical protein FKW44_018704 [Caligus rogercresseyi]